MEFPINTRIDTDQLTIAPLLADIRAGAAEADRERSIPEAVINKIKANPIMRFSAAEEIGGLDVGIEASAYELEAIAAACGSTGWVLWNHMCTFHLFAGLLGPDNADFLTDIVKRQQWVCFPAGASTAIRGTQQGDDLLLEGKAAFGSGGRYADWAGASFVVDENLERTLL